MIIEKGCYFFNFFLDISSCFLSFNILKKIFHSYQGNDLDFENKNIV